MAALPRNRPPLPFPSKFWRAESGMNPRGDSSPAARWRPTAREARRPGRSGAAFRGSTLLRKCLPEGRTALPGAEARRHPQPPPHRLHMRRGANMSEPPKAAGRPAKQHQLPPRNRVFQAPPERPPKNPKCAPSPKDRDEPPPPMPAAMETAHAQSSVLRQPPRASRLPRPQKQRPPAFKNPLSNRGKPPAENICRRKTGAEISGDAA